MQPMQPPPQMGSNAANYLYQQGQPANVPRDANALEMFAERLRSLDVMAGLVRGRLTEIVARAFGEAQPGAKERKPMPPVCGEVGEVYNLLETIAEQLIAAEALATRLAALA